jgi:hypothetical protein
MQPLPFAMCGILSSQMALRRLGRGETSPPHKNNPNTKHTHPPSRSREAGMRVIIHCFVRNGWVSFEKKAQGVTQGTTSMQGGTPDDEGIYVAQPVGDDAPQAGPFEPDFAPAVSVEVISQSPLTMHFAGVGTKMLCSDVPVTLCSFLPTAPR